MRTAVVLLLALTACNNRHEPPPRPAPGTANGSAGSAGDRSGATTPTPAPSPVPAPAAAGPVSNHDAIPRMDFNRWAVRQNIPVYWVADANTNGQLEPAEVASLLFYPTAGNWVADGKLTPDFEAAYAAIVAASKAPPPDTSTPEGKRQDLVGKDLDQGRPTLARSDLSALSPDDKAFVGHMLNVSSMIDTLYEQMNGAAAFADKLPADPASRSLFRRNRGPKCVAPLTEKDPACSAVPGGPPQIVFDLYPAELQSDKKFCAALAKDPNLSTPFSVVRGTKGKLTAQPYTEAYKPEMDAISAELAAAADSVKDATEKPLVDYLRAAAASFKSNDWQPADEAWAKMTVDNSKWYVRVAPDEVYWEPCSLKAGMHVTFARINQGSREWQQKLVPVQQEMEAAIAQRAGKPYAARNVTFHLPDFIDIIVNAGDDRDPLGATIGQSLPNWGPVANEGRGRTVAMTNLYLDQDSRDARRAQAESLLDAESMKAYAGTPEPGLLGTILHEATHNLGPAHEYKVNNKSASEVFGGPVASLLEELKAQTGALFLIEFLRAKKLISDELAAQSYADAIVWAFGHISQGMYDGDGKRKPYGNLAAIQIGYLRDKGVLVWDPKAQAANGKDTGAFSIKYDKLVPVVDQLMKTVAGIKARGDKAGAKALLDKYVESSKVVPHDVIKERFLRVPKANFVYSVAM